MLKPIVLIKEQDSSEKNVIISGLQLLSDLSLRQWKVKRESCPFTVTFVIDIASIHRNIQRENNAG